MHEHVYTKNGWLRGRGGYYVFWRCSCGEEMTLWEDA